MSHDPTISEPARRVIITISHQFNKEIEQSALRDRTRLTDSELLAILHELVKRGWVEHTGYPGSPSGDTWKMTSLGQSAQAPSLNRTQLTLFTEPDGTVVLRPRRSPRLACSLGIVSILSAFLLWGAVAMGWQWAALLDLVVFSGIWIALLT
jgi:DNA-binding MarR family transcriptional regulator